MKNVLITTQHRGVFFAQVEDGADVSARTLTNLKNCRMAIYWGTSYALWPLRSLYKHRLLLFRTTTTVTGKRHA